MKHIILRADKDASGVRLDKYVSSVPDGISRSRLKNALRSVTVNGIPVKLSKTLKCGDSIVLEWEDPEPADLLAQDIPLDILYEDVNVTVVNKVQGMVTHPAAGNWDNTLVNALLFHWKGGYQYSGTGLRPGIVHRLDKDTSGVLITARNVESETWLQEQFRQRRVKKVYAAILCGVPPDRDGVIRTQIVRDPRNRQRFTWSDNPDTGKFAHTVYHVAAVYGSYSLVLLKLKTGRTHQLRVHMKYLGCPILGDPIYGKKDTLFESASLMLHAKELRIRLPFAAEFSTFTAPVPFRFKKVIHELKNGGQ